MKHSQHFLEAFSPLPSDISVPQRILQEYQPESCLAHKGPDAFVLRLRRLDDGRLFVLKAVPAGTEDLAEEFRILNRLAPLLPDCIPEAADCFRQGETEYLLRDFLSGETLSRYGEREGTCSEGFCRQLGGKLCALLETFHSQEPPVIHRDIKPENILLLDNGGVGMIDFGIARQYKDGQDTDTRHMGTRVTAAPEQYGFAQTDQRTDIYALGMTLIWLVTGSYQREALAQTANLSPQLRQTLEKATAFAPEDRYPNAAAFAAALARQPLRRRRAVFAGTALLLLLAAGLLWGGTQMLPAAVHQGESTAAEQTVIFQSAAMENAVRQALNQPTGQISYSQLAQIRRLAAVGENSFGQEQVFDYRVSCFIDNQFQGDLPPGDIGDEDLQLLAYMPNLEELYLCRQEIQDISPLVQLPLHTLALCENQILDFSPLANLDQLEALYLGGNPGTDYSPLAGLKRLTTLTVEGSGSIGPAVVDNLNFLDGLSLRKLGLGLTLPKDGNWQPLTRQIALEELLLWDPDENAVAAANALSDLKILTIGDYYAPDLTALSGLSGLEVLNIHKGSLESLAGAESLSRLITLSIGYNQVTDLTPLTGLRQLNYLQLEDLAISDFSPLNQLPALGYVVIPAEQAPLVEAACPGYSFEIRPF